MSLNTIVHNLSKHVPVYVPAHGYHQVSPICGQFVSQTLDIRARSDLQVGNDSYLSSSAFSCQLYQLPLHLDLQSNFKNLLKSLLESPKQNCLDLQC